MYRYHCVRWAGALQVAPTHSHGVNANWIIEKKKSKKMRFSPRLQSTHILVLVRRANEIPMHLPHATILSALNCQFGGINVASCTCNYVTCDRRMTAKSKKDDTLCECHSPNPIGGKCFNVQSSHELSYAACSSCIETDGYEWRAAIANSSAHRIFFFLLFSIWKASRVVTPSAFISAVASVRFFCFIAVALLLFRTYMETWTRVTWSEDRVHTIYTYRSCFTRCFT